MIKTPLLIGRSRRFPDEIRLVPIIEALFGSCHFDLNLMICIKYLKQYLDISSELRIYFESFFGNSKSIV